MCASQTGKSALSQPKEKVMETCGKKTRTIASPNALGGKIQTQNWEQCGLEGTRSKGLESQQKGLEANVNTGTVTPRVLRPEM